MFTAQTLRFVHKHIQVREKTYIQNKHNITHIPKDEKGCAKLDQNFIMISNLLSIQN
jgi:hypothetical protein